MKQKLFFLAVIVIATTYSSCKKDSNNSYYDNVSCNEPDDSLNTYSLKIEVILNSSCVRSGCHNSESHKKKINLEGYDNSVSTFNKKPVLCAIYHSKGCKPMPKGSSKLSDEEIHDITCWAKNGYPQ